MKEARRVDLRSVVSGQELPFMVNNFDLFVSIPDKEGASIGIFLIELKDRQKELGPFERDGSLETAFIADMAGDEKEDILFVIRNAGSGSYVSLIMLIGTDDTYKSMTLPDLPATLSKGYMGHDRIDVIKGKIFRGYPKYVNNKAIRIDKNYDILKAIEGKIPVKIDPDSNVNPSGGYVEVIYDVQTNTWNYLR